MAGPYRITIYTAMPGTPLVDGNRQMGTSAAGHMWYQVSDGEVKNSYGFAPKEHGASSGPGKGYDTDTEAYQSPHYSRTMEITAEQYAKLKQFGDAAIEEDWRYFRGEYNGATNSCVDFTWGALKHAGFNIHRPDGDHTRWNCGFARAQRRYREPLRRSAPAGAQQAGHPATG